MAEVESFYNKIYISEAWTVCFIPALCKPVFLESWFWILRILSHLLLL